MEELQRGRSPSQGAQHRISHSRSPASQGAVQHPVGAAFNSSSLLSANNFDDFDVKGIVNLNNPSPFNASSQFSNPTTQNILDEGYLQAQPTQGAQPSPNFSNPGSNTISPGFLDSGIAGSDAEFDEQLFQNTNGNHDPTSIDPRFLDPQLLDAGDVPLGEGGNTSELLDSMATAQHSPTPPHLLPSDMQNNSYSPNLEQDTFGHNHVRQSSLDPSSAAYPPPQQGWAAGAAFKAHRRSASDTYSDISSQQASPYLGNTDSFDPLDQSSPLLQAQHDSSAMQTAIDFNQFSLSENQMAQHQHSHISPAHSPHISPRLMPQQQLPPFTGADNFGMPASMNDQFAGNGINAYPHQGFMMQSTPSNGGTDFGQASQMPLPEFRVDAAPEAQSQLFQSMPHPDRQHNALSPPDRTRSRNRARAASDPYGINGSRPTSPIGNRPRSPSLNPPTISIASVEAGLAPLDMSSNGPGSRSSSPGPDYIITNPRSASRSSSVSSSTADRRGRILDLADPSRPTAGTGDKTRAQKHPATFQCTLCPKRFTRAYNLRSHLRTHTDERPFVCTVCGKAFARQHDRKRHEGLHSGEKKFVCRGALKSGAQWGCGRRFARADALGRHFRSEAGRVCIKPLLDEEAAERQNAWLEQQQGAAMLPLPTSQQDPNQLLNPTGIGAGGMNPYLPAAILQQYPVLAGMQLDGPVGEDDVSGRSSYDASSGGEFEEYGDDAYAQQPVATGWPAGEWTSDYEGRT